MPLPSELKRHGQNLNSVYRYHFPCYLHIIVIKESISYASANYNSFETCNLEHYTKKRVFSQIILCDYAFKSLFKQMLQN